MKDKILEAVRIWVDKNRKVFWKYEVACFYRSYQISIDNLPEPSARDVHVVKYRNLLSDDQKLNLCGVIRKVCSLNNIIKPGSLTVELDFENGKVVVVAGGS